ncbi:MAG: hypothetical protein R3B70_18620 [Polyangiaceae bacterium]
MKRLFAARLRLLRAAPPPRLLLHGRFLAARTDETGGPYVYGAPAFGVGFAVGSAGSPPS